jgi:hypothetical protein
LAFILEKIWTYGVMPISGYQVQLLMPNIALGMTLQGISE